MLSKRAQVVIGIGLLIIAAAFLLIGLDFSLLEGDFITNGVASLNLFTQAVAAAENSIQSAPDYMNITIYGNNSLCTWSPQLSAYLCQGGARVNNLTYAVGPSLDPGVEQFAGGACFSLSLNPLAKFGVGGSAASVADEAVQGAETASTNLETQVEGDFVLAGEESEISSSEEGGEEASLFGANTLSQIKFVLSNVPVGREISYITDTLVTSTRTGLSTFQDETTAFFSSAADLLTGKISLSVVFSALKRVAINALLTYGAFFGTYLASEFLIPYLPLLVSKVVSFGGAAYHYLINYSMYLPVAGFSAGATLTALQRLGLIYYSSSQGYISIFPFFKTYSFRNTVSDISAGEQIVSQSPSIPPSLSNPSEGVDLSGAITGKESDLGSFASAGSYSTFYAALGTLFLTWVEDASCFQLAQGSSASSILSTIGNALTLFTVYQVTNARSLIGTYYIGDTGAVYVEGKYENKNVEVATPVIVDGQDLCQFTTNSPPINSSFPSELEPAANGNLVFSETSGLFNTQCNPNYRGFPITLSQFLNEINSGKSPVYINLPWDMALVFRNNYVCIYQLATNSHGTPLISFSNYYLPNYNEYFRGVPAEKLYTIATVIGFPLECIKSNVTVSNLFSDVLNGNAFYVNNKSNIGFSVPLTSYINYLSANIYGIGSYDGGQYVPGNVLGAKVSMGAASPAVAQIISLISLFHKIGINASVPIQSSTSYGYFNILGSIASQDILLSAETGLVGLPLAAFFGLVNSVLTSIMQANNLAQTYNASFGPTDYVSVYFSNSNNVLSFINYTTLYGIYPNSPTTISNSIFTGKISR
ncbi:MAG: hypothetical protein QXX36_00990 [Candidatus Rehaiarchaeum fermentans]|nr:hypothetical protein [Candidatus Rehaiarchaeum fermentans]MCW1297442.1 hypothetical protein [Candidatus Rehaiarchaeum fermentans]MCW1302190.1 hypothetical protein [Candidatus Rehaiarchaeum fermentans]